MEYIKKEEDGKEVENEEKEEWKCWAAIPQAYGSVLSQL